MKYRIYITQTWSFTDVIEAGSLDDAMEKAGEIAVDIDPITGDMTFGDDYVEVEEVR